MVLFVPVTMTLTFLYSSWHMSSCFFLVLAFSAASS